jgi:acetolactate synthase-1/2/3 large subunit
MADAWGRLTGQPGVAVVTAGPGVTDIVTAVANAHLDSVPMLSSVVVTLRRTTR